MKKNPYDFHVKYYAKKVYPSGLNDFNGVEANIVLFFLNADENSRQLKQYATDSPEESLRKIKEFRTNQASRRATE